LSGPIEARVDAAAKIRLSVIIGEAIVAGWSIGRAI
jgi:hypothetical protein